MSQKLENRPKACLPKGGTDGRKALADGMRCPCVICLDASTSMSGEPASELNLGLRQFYKEVRSKPALNSGLDVGIVTFASTAAVLRPPSRLTEEPPPTIGADGDTALGGALRLALDMFERRQGKYRTHGMEVVRPWLIVMTDGQPTDEWESQAWRVKNLAEMKEIAVLAVGVGPKADMAMLDRLCASSQPPVRLRGLEFGRFFQWLKEALALCGGTRPGQQLALPAVSGWNH